MIDRFGEEIDDEPTPAPRSQLAHNPACRNGWLGADLDGRMIPCLTCKPHLRTTVHTNDFGIR
ncbi:hypothetical protein [Rhodococcus sp. NPDC055024]